MIEATAGGATGAPRRSDRPITVVGIGDSVTAGYHCDCDAFSKLYATDLASARGLKTSSVNLGVMSSNTGPQSYPQARQFLQRERNVPGVRPYLGNGLGHSLDAYQAVLAPILDWLAAVAGTSTIVRLH